MKDKAETANAIKVPRKNGAAGVCIKIRYRTSIVNYTILASRNNYSIKNNT